MKNTTKLLLSGLVVCGTAALIACGDSSGSGGAGGGPTSSTTQAAVTNGVTNGATTKASSVTTTVTSTSTGMQFPVPPTLGTQIDRMGRPAINTALDETFLAVNSPPAVPSTDAIRGAAEDKYNADKDPTTWAATYTATFAAQLAILDALDAPDPGGCGNQAALTPGTTTAGAYNLLAAVLTNDQLWVATKTTTTCAGYLALETQFLGATTDDCGGRRPADDVIKTTFTAVSGAATGFDDGITDPGNHTATFPFLAAPHS